MQARATIEIERPIESVWEFLSEPCNDPQWCPKVRHVEPAGPARWRVLHQPMPLRPVVELVLERVDAAPPWHLELREEDSSSVFVVEYRLSASARGTRFTQISEFGWKALPKLAQRLLALGVRRDLKRQARELKRVLEQSEWP